MTWKKKKERNSQNKKTVTSKKNKQTNNNRQIKTRNRTSQKNNKKLSYSQSKACSELSLPSTAITTFRVGGEAIMNFEASHGKKEQHSHESLSLPLLLLLPLLPPYPSALARECM